MGGGEQRKAEEFIARWSPSSGAERSNFQAFMLELCDLLEVPRPDPATHNESENEYVFERAVMFRHDDGSQTVGRVDLYRRGSFILEGKQSRKREADPRTKELVQLGLALGNASFVRTGAGKREGRGWDAVMAAAKQQAEAYARALPKEDGWPPFIVIVDVGHVIEVFADFSLQGKHYAQFPDRQGYRIRLNDLLRPEIRERLRAVWLGPLSLDPARRSAQVTSDIAQLLAKLSKSLEGRGHNSSSVASFLMRCLFAMFAEDVGLLKEKSFIGLLQRHQGKVEQLHLALPHLWREMNAGGYSPTLGETILRFNGGLFRDPTALPLDEQDLQWLILAAQRDWTNVEPAIFGTLLERALDPDERAKLGAHYTPRAYVERLVLPTIIDPLTQDWRQVQAEAADLLKKEQKDKARLVVRAFHKTLCEIQVLDPACGTGNFLYVALELIKRLEGEVLELLADLGEQEYLEGLDSHTVDPHQFLGLEINPRAVVIAELVLWIGYLQWHFRTRGKVMPAEPVLKAFANIKQQDAVLAYDREEMLRDKAGHPLTRWDGKSTKLHPITGEAVPDSDKTIPLYKYVNPRPAVWPRADFIVGNPPFIGGKDLRQELGDGYAEALWKSRPHMPGGADFVTYWWDTAATLASNGGGGLRRFGFISTNSITQTFSRRVIAHHLEARKPVSLVFAIPDHPWLKSADHAAVRIAMTVAQAGASVGHLQMVIAEDGLDTDAPMIQLSDKSGVINAALSIGPALHQASPLAANDRLCYRGYQLIGGGFIVTPHQAAALGLGRTKGIEKVVKQYRNGRDLTARPRGVLVIDLYGHTAEQVQERYPKVYQWVVEHVKPERDQNNRETYKRNWWIFGEPRVELRAALKGLNRYIVTVETEKHRMFEFLDSSVAPDNKLIAIATDDACMLGILSSRLHVTWAIAAGGWLGVGNDPVYVKTACFDTFPFPNANATARDSIARLAERLDSFRKERLDEHGPLTMTKLYNALEKLRSGEEMDEADRAIHGMGLISLLKDIHDQLDEAVFRAYGWPRDLSDEEILGRLLALNKERAQEERDGKVRWLRPEFQAAKEAIATVRQVEADFGEAEVVAGKPAFPRTPAEQVSAVRGMLASEGRPVRAGELARRFKQGRRVEDRVGELLQIMAAIGQAQTENGSRYFASR
ncbi:MAG: class I SAM-dependent DNA methyltransferase [Alphaproteobacteria bacterium]|nr:class I SAM-dependent DNA methyltransferase [Alphaproteobacteria bacterium]